MRKLLIHTFATILVWVIIFSIYVADNGFVFSAGFNLSVTVFISWFLTIMVNLGVKMEYK